MTHNSKTAFASIQTIAGTASKNEKAILLAAHMKDELFKKVCQYAYDPFKTYGVAKLPASDLRFSECNPFDEHTWSLLDDLIARRLTGHQARDAIASELVALDVDSAELLKRILRKDLRAGFSEASCNKASKGMIPSFPYMRCCLPKDANLDEFDWKLGVLSQEKADGMFANLNVETESVTLTSRQGSPFPMEAFGELIKDANERLGPGNQYHGELLVRKGGVIAPREIGNGILNSILSGGSFEADEVPVYQVWDCIPLSSVKSKGKYEVAYLKRLTTIKWQLRSVTGTAIELIDARVYHSLADAYQHYRDLLAKGKEGTIIKNPHMIWKDGTSKEQVKLKLEADVDLKVVGIVPGKEGGKNEGRAGSLACVTSCGGLLVDVTVKNEAMRDRIDAANDDWIGRIIVVRANAVMSPSASNDLASLFLPRMVEHDYRTDKTEADSLQRVRDQFAAAVKAAW